MKIDKIILKPILVILFLVSFFHLEILPWRVWERNYRMLFIIPILAIFLCKGRYRFSNFTEHKFIFWYFFFIVLNCITCLIFREQSIFVSLLGWKSFFLILFIPTFMSWKLTIKQWEKVLESVFVIILFCYIIQYIFLDVEIFRLDKVRDFLEVETRVRIFSDGILFLGSLYSLNKFFTTKLKFKYSILYIASIFIIFMQGFRMLILGMIICSILLYFRINGFSKKIFIALFSLFILSSIAIELPIVQNKIDEIINRNENSNFENDDYVRVLLIDYFYNDHFKNNLELFLGSGMTKLAVDESKTEISQPLSKYARYRSQLAAYNHFYPADVGLIGLSWEAGIPFTITFILLLISMARKKVDKDYFYLGLFEFFCIIVGGTHAMCYWHNNIIYHVLVFVIIYKANIVYTLKQKTSGKNENSYLNSTI